MLIEIKVRYSEENKNYFATTQEFPHLVAHGQTPDEAVRKLEIAGEDLRPSPELPL